MGSLRKDLSISAGGIKAITRPPVFVVLASEPGVPGSRARGSLALWTGVDGATLWRMERLERPVPGITELALLVLWSCFQGSWGSIRM